jgi:hypothetical protein
MLALRVRRTLNMMNAEAIAVVLLTQASILVTTDAPAGHRVTLPGPN